MTKKTIDIVVAIYIVDFSDRKLGQVTQESEASEARLDLETSGL